LGFLIDTSIWVHVERGELSPADVALVTGSEPIYISPVTIAELSFGAQRATKPELRQERLTAIDRLMEKPMLVIDEATGEIFGRLAAELKATGRGHQFRIQDLWLASQAIQHGLRLLSHNRKDFEDVPGLNLLIFPSKSQLQRLKPEPPEPEQSESPEAEPPE
jgi:predicted nucleic acid-binding protein